MEPCQSLSAGAPPEMIRRRFSSSAELLPSVYASLVDFLAAKELLRFGPLMLPLVQALLWMTSPLRK